jgi:hypothetical protein
MTGVDPGKHSRDLAECQRELVTTLVHAGLPSCMRAKGYKVIGPY